MAMSGTDTATFSGHPFTLKLTLTVASQSVTTNKSTINWSLKAIKTGNFTPVTYDDSPTWAFSKDGSGHWGPYNFNGAIGQTITVSSGSFTFTHDADGGGSFTYTFSAHGLSTIGTASGSGSFTPDTIPRATQPTVSPTAGATDATYAISTSTVASSTFFHDIAYSIDGGSTYTSIVSNQAAAVTSTNWTPASSLIPNNTSTTAIIQVKTRSSSGGTIIGTKTVNLPLAIPSTMKPSVSSVSWTDAQTSAPDIPTLMGGTNRFLQRWSLLKPVVTATGTGGATIASSSVTMGGQTTPSGTAFSAAPVVSGACAFSANAIDSRNVPSDPYTNTVAVTAYNNPNLPTPTVVRTSDVAGLVPSPTGTYLAITPAASASDLTFSSVQKNLLEWQVETRPVGGSWTIPQAWTAATVSGVTWTTKYVLSSYASTTAYEVKVSVRDLFGKNGYDTANTVKSATVTVPSETVFMDWDGTAGIGMGKYHALGFLDVGGDIYMNGNKVIDFSAIATTTEVITGTSNVKVVSPLGLQAKVSTKTAIGLARLATSAEAITGTDDATIVTPLDLAAAINNLTPYKTTVSASTGFLISLTGGDEYEIVWSLTGDSGTAFQNLVRIAVSGTVNSGSIYSGNQAASGTATPNSDPYESVTSWHVFASGASRTKQWGTMRVKNFNSTGRIEAEASLGGRNLSTGSVSGLWAGSVEGQASAPNQLQFAPSAAASGWYTVKTIKYHV